MADKDLAAYCPTEIHEKRFLNKNMQAMQLSARASGRILRARNIAKLAGTEPIELDHIAAAIQFRSLDKAIIRNPAGNSKTPSAPSPFENNKQSSEYG